MIFFRKSLTRRILLMAAAAVIVAIVLIVIFTNKKGVKFRSKTDSFFVDNLPVKNLIRRYADTLQIEFDSTKTVGGAVTIVYKNKIIFTKTYGIRKAGTSLPVDEHTIFRLASVSKGFAGVLACILQQDSIICLDDRIKDYLPGFQLKTKLNTDSLTIRNTLSHTSGLVPHAFDNLADKKIPYPVILGELSNVDISAPPGELYSYQNAIFSILDTIVKIQTGKSYGEVLQKKVFAPLRMHDASTGPEVFSNENGDIAYPHILIGRDYVPRAPNLGYYDLLPAAGVNASITDLGKWLLALLGNKQHIINRDVLNSVETPVIITHLKRRYYQNWDRIDSKYYSLGWRIYFYKGRKVLYHGGYVRGYRAEIAFCPEEKIGIAFLQNSPNELASKVVPMFLNMWFEKNDTATIVARRR